MPSNQDIIDFTIAYRMGPYEKLQELRQLFSQSGLDLDKLTDAADNFFDAGDRMRQAIRSGDEPKISSAVEEFRQSSEELGLESDYVERLITEQKERVRPKTDLRR